MGENHSFNKKKKKNLNPELWHVNTETTELTVSEWMIVKCNKNPIELRLIKAVPLGTIQKRTPKKCGCEWTHKHLRAALLNPY